MPEANARKRRAVGCLACLFALGLSSLFARAALAQKDVLVVLEPDKATHRRVLEALTASVAPGGDRPPGLRVRTADLAAATAGPVPDLVVTIGTRAAEAVITGTGSPPVLSVLIPGTAYEQLARAVPSRADRLAAVVLDQPVGRQFAAARALLPGVRRASALLSPDDAALRSRLEEAARAYGFELDVHAVGAVDDAAGALERMMGTTELVLAVYDHRVFRPVTAKWMLYLGFQQRRPVIGFSFALLEAGAAAAVYSTPEQIGRHAGELVSSWLQTGRLPGGVAYPRYFDIGVNAPVADALGIPLQEPAALERTVRRSLEAGP